MDNNTEQAYGPHLRKLTAEDFVRRLRSYTSGDLAEARYAFFLGAGCSISSGIPGARSLIRERWLPRLRDIRAPDEEDPLKWARDCLAIDPDDLPPGTYGRVMTELFPQPALRQAEIEELCSVAGPGFGYATLAQLMTQVGGRFNIVLTTNFDDLIADALYLFTGSHPLLIHHGSLSPFIRATRTRPMVVKLHGHHQFLPHNTEQETQEIESGLADGVRSLLHDRGLIFVGYSGSDDGIRDVLAGLPSEALPYGIYWVSGDEPRGALRQWLDERSAIWVKHRGFDELMLHVRDVFELPMPSLKHVEEVFEGVQSDYLSLSAVIREQSGNAPEDTALKSAAARVDRTVRDWAVYELRAQRFKATDPKRAKAIYQEGLEALPDSLPLLNNYANLLKDISELDEAERLYLRALELNPEFPNVLHDYAIFLWRFREDVPKAQEYIDRAIAVDPGDDGLHLGNYANFIWEVGKDADRAEHLFGRAVSVATATPESFIQYAVFAQNERHDYRLADRLFREALGRRPDNVAALVSYARLASIMWDIETASGLLERAYAAADEDMFVLGALARHLWQQQRDHDRAESLFAKAYSKKPQNARETKFLAALVAEFAWFFAHERGDVARGMDLIDRAIALSSDDPEFLTTKAYFLAKIMDQPQVALTLLDDTITKHGESGALLGAKADLTWRHLNDRREAEQLYRRALELDADLVGDQVNFAGLLFVLGKSDQALPLCRDGLRKLGRAEPAVAVECTFYLFAHGPQEECDWALRLLKWLLVDGARSQEWDLSSNVARAVKRGHPNAEWLLRLAAVIRGSEDITILSAWSEWEQAQPPTFG